MDVDKIYQKRDTKYFNTPLELGIRALFIISNIGSDGCDLDRLVYYDYLLLHSSDVEDGPMSLHPAMPFRSGEILVKRELLKKGLNMMISKELITIKVSGQGILYTTTELTIPFINYFESNYSNSLKQLSSWVIKRFHSLSDKELSNYINANLNKWGGEFVREAYMRGVSYE